MSESQYKIGAVSKITGIGIETLRMWERRYGAVTPTRGSGTSRLYSEEDISRLTLLKQLVDKGNSISSVANLENDDLQQRMQKFEQLSDQSRVSNEPTNQSIQTLVCGRSLPIILKLNKDKGQSLNISQAVDNLEQLMDTVIADRPDMLILELAVINQEDIQTIKQALQHVACQHVLVIYAYCNKKVLKNLELEGIHALPAPIIPSLIARRCQEIVFNNITQTGSKQLIDTNAEPKSRLFDDATLAQVAHCSTSINCECPHHLSEIIYKLAAFEEYSASCENRNIEDKQLHSMLFNVANQARALFEESLQRVIEHEGIEIETKQ